MPLTTVPIDPNKFAIDPHTSEDLEFGGGFSDFTADGKSHVFTDTELRTIHNMLAHWRASQGLQRADVLDSFNRFYSVFPDMEMPQDLKSYIFITRPDMNLLSNEYRYSSRVTSMNIVADNSNDARIRQLAVLYPEILVMLTSDYSSDHQFIPYLQGRAESMQLPDYNIRTMDFTIPFFNYKFTYPTVTNESVTGGTFDINFREDADLRITNMFQFWVYYMDGVMKGLIKPSPTNIHENFYDFMCSVYEIVCDPSSERILYFAKYTGCYPTGVPTSNLSHNLRSNVDNHVNITFNYIKVEHLEPKILSDFNRNSTPYGAQEPVYDTTFGVSGQSLVGAPKIVWSSNKNALLLKWYRRKDGATKSLPSSIATAANMQTSQQNVAILKGQVESGNYYSNPASSFFSDPTPRFTQDRLSNYLTHNSDKIK